jgi:excinuclease ABC subunit C
VEIVHLILSRQSEAALKKIDRKIELLAENLEYELAAEWRDVRLTIEETTNNAKWQIDAAMMNDVITLTDEANFTRVNLTTLRRGKAVGKLDFQVVKKSPEQILPDFINGFYQFYAPKQIFVPCDFPHRKSLEEKLTLNFGHRVKIVALEMPEKLPPSVFKTQKLAAHSFKHKNYQTPFETSAALDEIKILFDLKKIPRRIECFDVAHLAGKEIIAARVTAIGGILQRDDGLVWEFENLSETAALAAAVRERIRLLPSKKGLPDLLMVDGAKPQINAVKKILDEFKLNNLIIIGAVKPPKAHNQISHFLTLENTRLKFDKRSRAMNFLQTLRDAAHRLANETHRELHSLVQIFVNNADAPRVQYLLVPMRYAERGGNAEDLSPIRSLTQAGEVILKTKSKRPPI